VTASDHALPDAALREILDLHSFFEGWLGGTLPNTDAAFSRLDHALAEGFSMVAPSGVRLGRAEVIHELRLAHGKRAGSGTFRIAVTEPEVVLLRPPVAVIGYVEEQRSGSTLTRRRSTAVLEGGGHGAGASIRWLALHETWIGSPP
jgi:hypothetical protein